MITIVSQQGDKVVQQVTKPDGSLVRYQYGVIGEPMAIAQTLKEAKMAILPDVIKVVDRKGGYVVQKVCTAEGVLKCYKTLLGDAEVIKTPTLAAARAAIVLPEHAAAQ